MISISVNPKSINAIYLEVESKVDGMKQLLSPQSKKQFIDVAFSKSALSFVKRTNMIARSDKSSFHHVYEWGGVGNETSRLFRIIKKNNSPGYASVYYKFNNSKKPSPIDPSLRTPGKTGKFVTKSGVFKNKASVMESGSPVSFVTKRTIAIPSSGAISFIPPGKVINIKNPGGKGTTGSFESHFRIWWTTEFSSALEKTNIPNQLEISLARALRVRGSGKSAAQNAINSTLSRYKVVGSII